MQGVFFCLRSFSVLFLRSWVKFVIGSTMKRKKEDFAAFKFVTLHRMTVAITNTTHVSQHYNITMTSKVCIQNIDCLLRVVLYRMTMAITSMTHVSQHYKHVKSMHTKFIACLSVWSCTGWRWRSPATWFTCHSITTWQHCNDVKSMHVFPYRMTGATTNTTHVSQHYNNTMTSKVCTQNIDCLLRVVLYRMTVATTSTTHVSQAWAYR
jgi:hypothetical protein